MLRFAPSPNGRLHKGHALSALANRHMADRLGLPLRLRMEDIDPGRCRPEYESAILDDLAWLGIAWTPPMWRQSTRFPAYADALARLRAMGLLYPSFASRREISEAARVPGIARDPDGAPVFPGDDAILGAAEAARRRASGEPAAWRLRMADALVRTGPLEAVTVDADGADPVRRPVDPALWGDVLLARKETPTSYHLAVVVDDAAQGITHVVRGEDLLPSTAVHRVLQSLLDLPAPAYRHHPLILGADGRKLSKSNGAEALQVLRDGGLSAAALRAELVPLL
ncbi:tRNA glutamyl-Q(34) synthetase GluQRS [Acuticoccus mangrovi]|uniref:tRNA glutamyl-Q(34) synthetase GluQRS n=1 Tax=Acuticoccus mangrovi TaxID=2796142 RepID=A0A934IPM1_9HYPH|nr:tRNA glutamyl-Q(34) synthetase GluQRS [Acuticoccus mangrovi]MBJ3777737.1 tRNA glutamyl-Q(34) synthetase GluQRS [Acuticoccus mangrovi]